MQHTTDHQLIITRRVLALSFVAVTLLYLLITASHTRAVQAQKTEDSLTQQTSATGQTASDTSQSPQEENNCVSCHEKIAQVFVLSAHGKAPLKSWRNGNGGPKAVALKCQTCHGDGVEHMADPGDVSKIKNPARLKAREASRTCTQCHAQMNEHASWPGSRHESAGLSCLSCHNMHQMPLPQLADNRMFASAQAETRLLRRRSEAETCLQCHGDIRKAQFQRSTHLFRNENREHQITCSSCHEPHGSIGDRMMRTAQVNETCYQCHTEKRGPFLYEHSPVRESCLTCHKAHGSNHNTLLNARAPMLCQQCHIQGRHQTVAGRPNAAFTFNRACVTCHSAIHGSNHPSGINLQR
ncbi:MAG TPA: DmsE family decaheme c-type cytochrome [Blastocatellia bacterium]|nr:DmsE family decaheme c-type cytochrome [Blastocatellia bacterium]